MLDTLFSNYDRLFLFDTETTGLSFPRDEIIEFSAVVVERQNGEVVVTEEYDCLISLTPGNCVPPMITELTGISNEDIAQRGVPKAQVCADVARMIAGNTLLLAYNAHFDLSFLYYSLARCGLAAALKGIDMLDALTVYKDRRDYPHKLEAAIEQYGLQDKVVNSHRAIDDTLALKEVLIAMEQELPDLHRYLNLFGYNPKFGVSGAKISSVTYKPQPYNDYTKLYLK